MSDGASVDSPLLTRAWSEQQLWSRTAGRLKTVVDRGRLAGLLLAGGTAVAAAAATQASGVLGRSLTAVAAVTAGVATIINRRIGSDRIRAWTRARAAAEALKREVYAMLAGGSAYLGPDAADVFARRFAEIIDNVDDLRRHTLGVQAGDRELPEVADIDDYVRKRVGAQVDGYYRPRAAIYERRVRRLRLSGDALGVLAVVLAAVGAAFGMDGLSLWVPVVTTIGVSVTAHLAAARYDPLVIEYLATAQRLDRLRFEHGTGHLTDPALVDACEDAISAENQSWVAHWSQTDDDD